MARVKALQMLALLQTKHCVEEKVQLGLHLLETLGEIVMLLGQGVILPARSCIVAILLLIPP